MVVNADVVEDVGCLYIKMEEGVIRRERESELKKKNSDQNDAWFLNSFRDVHSVKKGD